MSRISAEPRPPIETDDRAGGGSIHGPMSLRLRNTLSRAVEPVVASDGERVRMYTCGPTVYRYAHVGNFRSYVLADLIRRVSERQRIRVGHGGRLSPSAA